MHLKNLLQGNFDRNGCGKVAAYAMTLSSIIIPLAIRSGKYDSNYLAWFNPIFYGLVGVAGTLDRNLGMKLMGHKEGIDANGDHWDVLLFTQDMFGEIQTPENKKVSNASSRALAL